MNLFIENSIPGPGENSGPGVTKLFSAPLVSKGIVRQQAVTGSAVSEK